MTLKIRRSTISAAMQEMIADLFDGATEDDYGKLVLYQGVRPASIETAVPDTDIMLEYTLPRGTAGYQIGSDSTKVFFDLKGLIPKLAEQTGEVTFFRLLRPSSALPVIFEGDVTDRNGSGELKIATTSILAGLYVRMETARISIPHEI